MYTIIPVTCIIPSPPGPIPFLPSLHSPIYYAYTFWTFGRYKLTRIKMRNIKKRRQLETNKQMYRWETAGLSILTSPLPSVMRVISPSKTLPHSPHASLAGFYTISQ
ncbi:hypothetical protein E2C01_090323 [Portunus trituberculatus]|uniref:Uncharacterized protein n=1 Tax=Portunus trituberculatus TaxID=210409 RepID=A0A5B7JPT5_PORTR|nr:hypothetical protein [Portunus trituberculatus]